MLGWVRWEWDYGEERGLQQFRQAEAAYLIPTFVPRGGVVTEGPRAITSPTP